MSMPSTSRSVAVIGAGASGLVTARELQREGHKVTVFEKSDKVGGLWVYDPRTESDPLGVDPTRSVIHSSLYNSLRTNLPREIMGFKDFPFAPRKCVSVDTRRFPSHREVLVYLEEFAREFGIREMVRFQSEVVKVWLDKESQNWRVKIRNDRGFEEHVFDAVVICVGHYTQPRLAEINGICSWPGKQMHSHNFRNPEMFRNQVVIVIGKSTSSNDISRDIAGVAKEIERANEDGSVRFRNGKVVAASIIVHCTGSLLSPRLSIKASGSLAFCQAEMMEDVKSFYAALEASNVPKHYTHRMATSQCEYFNWLADQCRCSGIEEWRERMCNEFFKMLGVRLNGLREEWVDGEFIVEAYKDFSKYTI